MDSKPFFEMGESGGRGKKERARRQGSFSKSKEGVCVGVKKIKGREFWWSLEDRLYCYGNRLTGCRLAAFFFPFILRREGFLNAKDKKERLDLKILLWELMSVWIIINRKIWNLLWSLCQSTIVIVLSADIIFDLCPW